MKGWSSIMIKLEAKREVNSRDNFFYNGRNYIIIKEDNENINNFQCLYKDNTNNIVFESIPKTEMPKTHQKYSYLYANGFLFKRGDVIFVKKKSPDGSIEKFNAIVTNSGIQAISYMYRTMMGQDRVDMITASKLFDDDIVVMLYEMPE